VHVTRVLLGRAGRISKKTPDRRSTRRLALARDNDDKLSEHELLNLGIWLLIAGNETTANQIANFTYVLLTRDRYWDPLRNRPDLIPGAIEELLRHVPARRRRWATQDSHRGCAARRSHASPSTNRSATSSSCRAVLNPGHSG